MANERIQHGINGPEPPLFSRNVHPTTTPFKYVRDAATSHNKTSILKEAGPYIAEVIRVFETYTLGQSTGKVPLDYWNHFEGEESGDIVVMRVRIPEIDTFGIPQQLPVNDEDFANLSPGDKHLVERYPKCIAKWLNMPRPAVGQAVWVDFRDPKNRSGRMYLGIVNTAQASLDSGDSGSGDGDSSTKDDFDQGTDADKALATQRSRNALKRGIKIPEADKGDIALLVGDSQMKGRLGEALAKRLTTLGWQLLPKGAVKGQTQRAATARTGSSIKPWLLQVCAIQDGKPEWGKAGFKCINKYLTRTQPPKVVYICLSGNGGTGKQAVKFINMIRDATGEATQIVWFLAPKSHDAPGGKQRAYMNQGTANGTCQAPKTGSNCGRLARNLEIQMAIAELDKVMIIDPQIELPDYKPDETNAHDGLHLGKKAAERLINNISRGLLTAEQRQKQLQENLLVGGCFVAGTKIAVVDELGNKHEKNIQDVHVGDTVLSYNFALGALENKRVTSTFNPIHNDLTKFTFDNNTSTIHTYDHPYYVINKGWASLSPDFTKHRYAEHSSELLDTKLINVGDQCLLDDGITYTTLIDVQVVHGNNVMTYNIRVEDNNNYFADGILVHNK